MVFTKGDQRRFVAWTTSASPRKVMVPIGPGKFAVTGHTGERLPAVATEGNKLSMTLTDAPQYLVPE